MTGSSRPICGSARLPAGIVPIGTARDQGGDWSRHVGRSYAWVRDRLLENREVLAPRIGYDTIDRTAEALSFWVDSANAGNIGWALFVATKPS